MQTEEAFSRFPYLLLRLALRPQEALKLPAQNKGNTLRGAFGLSFRRLVCVPECRSAQACPLAETCPYKLIFEPSPPQGSDRLSKNQDIPRPFVFRPPLDSKTTYEAGEPFEFELVLLGTAVNYLPYFVLAFREVVSGGFGLNRARCELTQVTGNRGQGTEEGEQATVYRQSVTGRGTPDVGGTAHPTPGQQTGSFYNRSPVTRNLLPVASVLSPVPSHLVYSSADQVFHQPKPLTLGDYASARLPLFPVTCNLSPIRVSFLSPTFLRADGQLIREPEFHHLFKRLRDRLNALSAFYGPGPIDADFKALGELAEKVRTVKRDVHWVERYRTSSKTHQRHELSGFIGTCVFDFSGVECSRSPEGVTRNPETAILNALEGARDLQSGFSNLNVFSLLPWLLAGEICHVGRHAAWGNGWIDLRASPAKE